MKRPTETNPSWPDVVAELHRLDGTVRARAAVLAAAPPGQDALRGLVVSDSEFADLVTRRWSPPEGSAVASSSAWGRLLVTLDLTSFEQDLLLLCLALELDRGYERIYAYLQDDITARQPTAGLALDLLCDTPRQRLSARRFFAAQAPLRAWRLIRLLPGRDNTSSLLGRPLALAPGVAAHLLDGDGLPSWITRQALDESTSSLDELPADVQATLSPLAENAGARWWIHLLADDEGEARQCALALAGGWGMPLLTVSPTRLPSQPAALRRAARDALLQGATLYVPRPAVEAFPAQAWAEVVRDLPTPVLWGCPPVQARGAATVPWPPTDDDAWRTSRVEIPDPSYERRRQLWERALGARRDALDLDALAGRYRLSHDQIAQAARMARDEAQQRNGAGGRIAEDDLYAAARAVSSPDLGSYAQRIDPRHTWDDIILPPDQVSQLRELCDQFRYRHIVYDTWGMGGRSQLGRGLAALFAGPSGTGKTLAAEVIASELALDLFKIDLSGIVSKYVGETEKNLERIFSQARHANAILLFDEADALFGKRSETKDAHDRYANIEISYLLQKVEEYDGVVILTSNLQQNLDEAFLRRLHFVVAFPVPGEAARRMIWQQHLPATLPREDGLDPSELARRWRFTGGSIRNVALSAAFLAARKGRALGMEHLLWAARREFQKLGKLVDERQFAPDGLDAT